MRKQPIFTFKHGLVLGLISGLAYALQHNHKSGAENRQQIKDYAQGTMADVKKLTDAGKRVQQAAADFKDATDTYLTPATDGIKHDVANYKFQTDPLLNQIGSSLDAINAAANSDDNNK